MDPHGPPERPDGAGPVSPGPEEPADDASPLDATTSALVHAFVGISSDLDTRSVLARIVLSGCELTGARYGALGTIGHDGRLAEFIPHSADPSAFTGVGHPPEGKGLLDPASADAGPLRLEDLSTHPEFHGFPDGYPTMRSLLRVPVKVRGTAFGLLYLSEKVDGTPFTEHDQARVEALATVAGFVIENARAYALSERRRRWLELFGELNELMTPPIALQEALERIVEAVRGASGALSATIVQVPEKGEPFVAARIGETEELDTDERLRFNVAIRQVAHDGTVLDLDVRDKVAVLVPLRAHLTVPGVLIASHQRRSETDALEERELLSSFADQAALALDRTQALEDRERMAVVYDRDRIARELHDVVIQRLFAIGLQMQAIRQLATTDELRARMDENVRDLDQTIRDIRSTIFELHNRPQNSLRTEVRDLVREFVPILGFAPSVQMHGPVDKSVQAKLQQQLVAVLREALSNVARHAEAGSASIDLRVTDTHLRLRVTDNGKGIPDDRVENGIRSARRRAVLLGGSLDLWPGEPTGTSFIWSVPFQQGDA